MTNQNFENSESRASDHQQRNKRMRDAGDTFAQATDRVRDAGEKGKRAASDTASTMSGHVMGILNEQISVGTQSASRLASSMRLAADDLAQESPLVASLVRGFANNVEDYAERLDGQNVEQLAQRASDFTRRQPALVFGVAAIAGFFAFRTFKNARSVTSPSIQPTHSNHVSEGRG